MSSTARWAGAGIASATVAAIATRRDALSPSGAVGATLLGTTVLAGGGLRAATLLLAFFGSSTALARVRQTLGAAEPGPPPRRTWAQVMANGAVPALLALAPHGPAAAVMAEAYAGALAAVNADTWATEIGALSHAPPRSIVTGRHVEKGASGGITGVGCLASLAGAAVIGLVHAAVNERTEASPRRVIYAGITGSLVDSVLGATLQARYLCPDCGALVENRRHIHERQSCRLQLVQGWPFMTNDTVNLCASLTGAALAAVRLRLR